MKRELSPAVLIATISAVVLCAFGAICISLARSDYHAPEVRNVNMDPTRKATMGGARKGPANSLHASSGE